MLVGKYNHTIDDNSRLAIPSQIRKCIDEKVDGQGFYVTPGLDGCLDIYPPRYFKEFTNKLQQLVSTNKKVRQYMRLFFSKTSGCVTCDKQGRIIIPQVLREHAGLRKDVIIIGSMDKIEAWDAKRWNEFEADNNQNFEDVAEDLFQLGFAPNVGQKPPI